MNSFLVTPFLMGQRRDGLCRIQAISDQLWEVVAPSDLVAVKIDSSIEKLRRMGVIYRELSERIKTLTLLKNIPIILAGDCVSSLGVLSGLQKARKPPDRILWLDAHGDFHTWSTSVTKYIGGMPLAMLVGRVDQCEEHSDSINAMFLEIGFASYCEKRIVLSDGRDLDSSEKIALKNSEIIICNLSNVLEHLDPHESLYIHWDTDVVDAEKETPALKYHVKGGPSYQDIENLFEKLSSYNIVALSISAWHSEKDLEDKAVKACLKVIASLRGCRE